MQVSGLSVVPISSVPGVRGPQPIHADHNVYSFCGQMIMIMNTAARKLTQDSSYLLTMF